MKIWQKILVPTLITLAIGSIYLFVVWRHRQDPGKTVQNDPNQALSKDDLVVMRAYFMSHFDDTLRLEGTSVWMKNGYTMSYYPYKGGRVVFAERVGLIPPAQRLDVKKIVKAVAPPSVSDGVGHGSRQVFAVFALPGAADLYATPIGSIEGSQEQYFCDLLFFYDDPHDIYAHWPRDIWAAIDAHQVKPGMNELQTRMSIGQQMHPDGPVEGDRTVTYDEQGKHWTVTFVRNRATVIKIA